MRTKWIAISTIATLLLLVCNSFIGDNPFFKISVKDVELRIPKGFPKPYYQFKDNKLTPDKFTLGRKLFYDDLLSKDNSINCGTCHQPFAAFAHIDHALSHGIYAKIGTRNVPALQNLIWKDTYMWDGGVNHLEVQPINPITNPIEMDESIANVVLKLKKDSSYKALFKRAYHDTVINSERLLKSLAQFTGLMISANSRYDKYLAGKDSFSIAEKNGLKLFRSKCANCHTEPLFTDNSYRHNGLKKNSALNDLGRGKITGNKHDNYVFKVPSLRNIEMTYPYMHDGRFKNLQQVINHYSQAKMFDALVDSSLYRIGELSSTEKTNIIAFLKTLTDYSFLHDKRFMNPNSN